MLGEMAYQKAARERRQLQQAVKLGTKARAYEEKERQRMDEFRRAMGLPPAAAAEDSDEEAPVLIGPRPPVA